MNTDTGQRAPAPPTRPEASDACATVQSQERGLKWPTPGVDVPKQAVVEIAHEGAIRLIRETDAFCHDVMLLPKAVAPLSSGFLPDGAFESLELVLWYQACDTPHRLVLRADGTWSFTAKVGL